ncbi:SLATT domain-containing protein [Flavobacterium sp. GSP6]|uniref:SLATT domain-containing protein n=1 Tax=Flavobacterium sp. GSP6 TaxID=2497488 RepID=UPI000F8684DB|nr:SLATT domain-containing protein [Flavobacterium sp. GSP6]RTZ02339.1 SLATT domain-containing protein [Flavobacterium sp. GSP6]
MTKEMVLKSLATNGYNVGFGAKKNFASYDLVIKLPSWIGFITLALGIIQLGYPVIGNCKWLSTILILVSVAALYINVFNSTADKFEEEGIRLTKLFSRLRNLYLKVKSSDKNDFTDEVNEMNGIMDEYYSNVISKQVFMSQWFAHFKFFYEMQIDWVDEQLKFGFFKDKIPNSLKSTTIFLFIIFLIYVYYEYIRCV